MKHDLSLRAGDLRSEFDRSFATARIAGGPAEVDLLGIRAGGDPYAVRLCEVARVFKDKPISPLPTPMRALVGIAGFRGAIHPVYDLRMLLGYERSGRQQWLLLAAGAPIGFLFEQLDGQFRVPEEEVESARPLVSLRGLIDRLMAERSR